MKIFINYRRDDSAGYAGRLFDYLTAHFGENSVFMDIDTIQPGEDFRKVIAKAVGTCDVVLVIIGKQWLSMPDPQGQRRLDDPRDWVRVEIAAALSHPRVRVIPILVRDANMPGARELPDELKELSWRNAIELSDTRFQYDAGKLVEVIERIPVKSPRMQAGRPRKSGAARYWGVAIGVVAIAGIITAVSYGILSMVVMETPMPAVLFTPTSPPPSIPVVDIPILTSTPTENIPTMTPTVIPPASDAVYNYYAQISAGNYETTWNLLTGSFKEKVNPTGFEPYREYWSSVDRVIVGRTFTASDDGITATIIADLVYYYHDGRVISEIGTEISLVYDTQRKTWLINAKP